MLAESSERMVVVESINDCVVPLKQSICTVLIRNRWGVLEAFCFCGIMLKPMVWIKNTSGE